MTQPLEPVTPILPDWLAGKLADANASFHDDIEPMRLAIDLAAENVRRDAGGPFGAVIIDARGRLLGAGVNLVVSGHSSVFHAEIIALLTAQAATGTHALAADLSATLYTSCEPCAMCLGAIQWSGLRRVVWAATRHDASALGFDEGPVFPESHEYLELRGITLEAGPMRREARAVLDDYRDAGGVIYNP